MKILYSTCFLDGKLFSRAIGLEPARWSWSELSKRLRKYSGLIFLFLVGVGFTAIGVYVTLDRIDFSNKSLTAKAVVVDFTSSYSSDSNSHTVMYYPLFQFVNAKTGEKVTAQGSVGSSSRPYSVGQTVEILYNPDNPTTGVVANDFWDLWLPSIAMLPSGIALITISTVAITRGKTLSNSGQPLFSRSGVACQECGVKDSTVQLYMRYGDRNFMGMRVPIIARELCQNCRRKYELEDEGFRICEHCGDKIPLKGNCPNCGAPQ